MICEKNLKIFIPAIRAKIAKILANKYNFSQIKIAESLGITQAAVSKYLAGKYGEKIKNVEKEMEIIKLSNSAAKKIAKGKIAKIKIKNICVSCKKECKVKIKVV